MSPDKANEIVVLTVCSDCGAFFAGTHGYPVVCKECWDNYTEKERKEAKKAGYQRAIKDIL